MGARGGSKDSGSKKGPGQRRPSAPARSRRTAAETTAQGKPPKSTSESENQVSTAGKVEDGTPLKTQETVKPTVTPAAAKPAETQMASVKGNDTQQVAKPTVERPKKPDPVATPEAKAAAEPKASPAPTVREKTPGQVQTGPVKTEPVKPVPPSAPKKSRVEEQKPQPPSMAEVAPDEQVAAILKADHGDPFAFLGLHIASSGEHVIARAFLPGAETVHVLDSKTGGEVATLSRIREEGMFAGVVTGRTKPFPYRFRCETRGKTIDLEDPYRFPPVLSEDDTRLLADGSHRNSYARLGAQVAEMEGVKGVQFAVWAPNANRVAVVGEFNGWDGRCHGMRLRHDCGVWEIFIPGLKVGQFYKYEIKSRMGVLLTDKSDPHGFAVEPSPGSASIICDLGAHRWKDKAWMAGRDKTDPRHRPVSMYQVHLGSWRRKPEEDNRSLTYRECADELVSYVKDMAFTHVLLMPISESSSDASLGYQPVAPFAPTSRWGSPEGLQHLIDRCHQAEIGVIVDWVANHFFDDVHGLGNFDGTHLYEHPDEQRRSHPGSNTLIYDYGRREVANYLLSNALFWLDRYHVDGLMLGSIASMLYLDYGRGRGEWTPNRFGGHENLEALDFVRRFNEEVYGEWPGVFTIGEDASGWPRLSDPTFLGGLGFGFKTNIEWTRETLRYLSRNPVHRRYYHDELINGASKAFEENFILPLSNQDVGYGKGSMLNKMTGDRWQRFAQLRAYYAFMYGHPGKKLMFMGNEFAQEREWNSDISLDWHALDDPMNRGVQTLMRDLNTLYRSLPSLHELDCEAEGFEWIDCNDTDQGVVSFIRQGKKVANPVVVAAHFTPVPRPNYRLGVPQPGYYRECLNTDAEVYGGGNVGNGGGVFASEEPMHGRPYSISVTLPPMATVMFHLEDQEEITSDESDDPKRAETSPDLAFKVAL